MRGQLYIITSPSGGGKSSILKGVFANPLLIDKLSFSISHTTRQPRFGEQDGREYYFVTKEKFRTMIAQHKFIEFAKVFDNFYGTSYQSIALLLEQGIDVFLDIDWQGALQIKEKMPQSLSIFVIPPSLKVLNDRLVGRGTDSIETIERRLLQARDDVKEASSFDYVIVNENLQTAIEQVSYIVLGNRLRRTQQEQEINQLIDSF